MELDEAEIAEWTAQNERSREAYYHGPDLYFKSVESLRNRRSYPAGNHQPTSSRALRTALVALQQANLKVYRQGRMIYWLTHEIIELKGRLGEVTLDANGKKHVYDESFLADPRGEERHEKSTPLNDIEIKKDDLLAKLRANRETHHDTYQRAVDEFQRQQVKILEELVAKARNGQPFDRLALSRLAVPEDHTDDYDLAIEMLELDERDSITLEQREFRTYYRDEWEWRQRWIGSTQSYVAG